MKRQDDLFSDRFTPTKVGFWHQPFHYEALIEGLSGDEAEALRYEYQLVMAGHRDILGRPCLCGDKTVTFPAAIRGGRPGAHDSLGSTISLVADLNHAADQLPILWRETEKVLPCRSELRPGAAACARPALARSPIWDASTRGRSWRTHWVGSVYVAGHAPNRPR
jgi:hypothetical protein